MQQIVRVALLYFLVTLVSGPKALAGVNDWRFTVGSFWDQIGTRGSVGVYDQSVDGYDEGDQQMDPEADVCVAAYKAAGQDGWDGPTGFYKSDQRAPLPTTAGAAKTWQFYVWADPDLDQSAEHISLTLDPHRLPSGDEMSFWLTLADIPSGVSGGPEPGTSYALTATSSLRLSLPVFRTDNGLEGYLFELTATVIPEPTSLLALGGGVLCLWGVFRRRK